MDPCYLEGVAIWLMTMIATCGGQPGDPKFDELFMRTQAKVFFTQGNCTQRDIFGRREFTEPESIETKLTDIEPCHQRSCMMGEDDISQIRDPKLVEMIERDGNICDMHENSCKWDFDGYYPDRQCECEHGDQVYEFHVTWPANRRAFNASSRGGIDCNGGRERQGYHVQCSFDNRDWWPSWLRYCQPTIMLEDECL